MKVSIYLDGDDKTMTVFNENEWKKIDKTALIGKTIKNIEFDDLGEVTILELE